ncbi:type II toxin-antitoxin system ParD family antitoxin [Bosea sp. (in: a-proteobacteria)]|uniref:type II toxin-antitoxin system ParD family antitoxin n=1 Tax=Bosea sp. (in: a-proteobacteria) TaxID=1871050 RepID=UPI003B3A17D6
MRDTEQLSITLPVELAHMVKDKVRSGAYASESEVIRDGLRALIERDGPVEAWLRDEVGPAIDRYRADPARMSSLEDVFGRLDTVLNGPPRTSG